MHRHAFAPLTPLIMAGSLGAATVLGFAPFYLFPLPVITLALLLGLWRKAESPRRAAALGFAFGLGFFGAGVSWIYISLHDFGGMPAAIAGVGTALLCAVLALFPAAVAFLQAKLPASSVVRFVLAVPALWAGADWLRSYLFTGFPWLAIGYSQVPASPLSGFAPILGVYGVSLVTAMSAGLATYLYAKIKSPRAGASAPFFKGGLKGISPFKKGRSRWGGICISVFIVLLWPIGYALKQIDWTQPIGEALAVSLLQGNVAQELKWREDQVDNTLKTYLDLVLASRARLIILPEAAFPLLRDQVPEKYLARIAGHAEQLGGDVLIGLPERDGNGYYNSVFSFGTAPTQVYRKSHLVPFGEFIPPGFGWVLRWLQIPMSDFSRGAVYQKPLEVGGQKVAVDICYEDVFGEEIIRMLPQATLLVNVSNDAWFGDSLAIPQHLQIAQARALETGRVMLRSTNTGATAAIAPDGQLIRVAPLSEKTALNVAVQGYTGATPYVRWGNSLLLTIVVILLVISFVRARALPVAGKKQ
ncbi:MAG: apolipoprotein N-acyltransferase [Burkholderiales bacterium]|nr:apolipoprotein N-acyltransferase [Burkholderiales bacterium]